MLPTLLQPSAVSPFKYGASLPTIPSSFTTKPIQPEQQQQQHRASRQSATSSPVDPIPMALALSGSAAARALAQLTTRGYAAAAASGAMRRGAADRKAAGEAEKAAIDGSWVPDPVTGHYRPANRAAPADPADLRAAHLGRTYARA